MKKSKKNIFLIFSFIWLTSLAHATEFNPATVFPGVNIRALAQLNVRFIENEDLTGGLVPADEIDPHTVGANAARHFLGTNATPGDCYPAIYNNIAGKVILEVGAGSGFTTGSLLLTDAAHVTAIEQSKAAAKQLLENIKEYKEIAPQNKDFCSATRFKLIRGDILNDKLILDKKYNIVLLIHVLKFMTPQQAFDALHKIRESMIEDPESRIFIDTDATPDDESLFYCYITARAEGRKYPGHIGYKANTQRRITHCEYLGGAADHPISYPAPILHIVNGEGENRIRTASIFMADLETMTELLSATGFDIVDSFYYTDQKSMTQTPADPTWNNFGGFQISIIAKPRIAENI